MTDSSGATLAAVFTAAGIAAVIATWLAYRELRRRAILDRPNWRSSHADPTPRGGGLGVVPVVLIAWAVIAARDPALAGLGVILTAGLGLALVSWLDDLRGLPPVVRLIVQIAAVAAGLAAMPSDAPVFNGILPLPIDRLVAGLLWLWFVNLFNFMDGIDGISGVELATIGGGLALASLVSGIIAGIPLLATVLAGAAVGFLVWNWPPARVFLGDVGSVPLGYLCGWLLIHSSQLGLWWAAAILPLYYLADATITLLRRLFRKERVWEAHREHFYQTAAQRGLSHAQVTTRVLATNLVLVFAAVASPFAGAWSVLVAIAAVAALIIALTRAR